jgi:hypothetical protein
MTNQAKITQGMYMMYNGTVYAELTDISAPPFSVEKVDATSHDSTYKVSVPGQGSFGDMTFKGYFVNDTAQAALRVLALAKTTGTWKIVYPSTFGTLAYSIPGFISSYSVITPMKGAPATFSVTITPTESVTEVTTAGAALTTPFWSMDDEHGTEITSLFTTPAAATYTIDGTIYADNTGFTLKPTATAGTIYVDGTVVTTGNDSSLISMPLASYPSGSIKTTFIVVDQGASYVPKIYRFRITRGTANHP